MAPPSAAIGQCGNSRCPHVLPSAYIRVTPVGLFVGHAAARLRAAGEYCTFGSHGPDVNAAPASLDGIL